MKMMASKTASKTVSKKTALNMTVSKKTMLKMTVSKKTTLKMTVLKRMKMVLNRTALKEKPSDG